MLEVVDRGSGLVVPVIPVALIDRIDASSLGDTDIGMGQQEFSTLGSSVNPCTP